MEKTCVCLLKMPDRIGEAPLSNAVRAREIEKTGNEQKKREKYWVFRLFEDSLSAFFGLSAENARPDPDGKWKTDGVYFSFSHSGDYAAVALSDRPIGIDVQKIEAAIPKTLAERALTESEKKRLAQTREAEKTRAFFSIWAQKEALFKESEQAVFRPERWETQNAAAWPIDIYDLPDAVIAASRPVGRAAFYVAEVAGRRLLFTEIHPESRKEESK